MAITRFDTFDETIRKHHLFNPEVYIEDPDKMAGVALHLMELGYDIECVSVHIGGLFKGKQYLSYDRLSRQEILSINKYGSINAGCIGDFHSNREDVGHRDKIINLLNENCEKYRYIEVDGKTIDLHPISCEDNVELFKALALYRDDTDYGKLVYYENPPKEWYEHNYNEKDRLWVNCQWDNFEKDCDVDWVKERCKMLNTLEDILKYKDLL